MDEEDDEQDEDDHLSDENAVEGPEEDPCREFSVCVLYVVEVRASLSYQYSKDKRGDKRGRRLLSLKQRRLRTVKLLFSPLYHLYC